MTYKIAKVISIVTVAPFIGVMVLSWMWYDNPAYFAGNINWYYISLVLLTLVPVSAYLFKYFMPAIRIKGRDGERKLAFIMAVIGYLLGILVFWIFHGPWALFVLFCAYFISGFTLLLFNRYVNIKASGHACGLVGPIAFLICIVGGYSWFTAFLIPLVFWARIKLGRHDMIELIVGSLTSLIPAMVFVLILTI